MTRFLTAAVLTMLAAAPVAAQQTTTPAGGQAPGTQPVLPSGATPTATKQSDQRGTPRPARPNVRQGSNFFGLPLLALAGLGGAGAGVAALASGGGASPQ